jgi:hypothetical protein
MKPKTGDFKLGRWADVDHFLKRVEFEPMSGCWIWTGWRLPKGYGLINLPRANGIQRRFVYAHRLSYRLFKGEFPSDRLVLHKCDTPPCVNPDHLILGTDSDNKQDAVAKGRAYAGEKNNQAKLTNQDVNSIRQLRQNGWRLASLAEKYATCVSNISEICSYKAWNQ